MLPFILAQAVNTPPERGYIELQMAKPSSQKIIREFDRPVPPKPSTTTRQPSKNQAEEPEQRQVPTDPVHVDLLTTNIIPEKATAQVRAQNRTPYGLRNVTIHYQVPSSSPREVIISCASTLQPSETCETMISGPATIMFVKGTPYRYGL